jgi:hypothetical protein
MTSWGYTVEEEEVIDRMMKIVRQTERINKTPRDGISTMRAVEPPFPTTNTQPSFRVANFGGKGKILLSFYDRVWCIPACIRVARYGSIKVHGVVYAVTEGDHTEVITDSLDQTQLFLESNLKTTAKLRLAQAKNSRSFFTKHKIDLRKQVPDIVIDAMLGRNLENAKTKTLYLAIKKDRENGAL